MDHKQWNKGNKKGYRESGYIPYRYGKGAHLLHRFKNAGIVKKHGRIHITF